MAQLSVNIGVTLRASSELITAVSGGQISTTVAIYGTTALFLFYGVLGGLRAAIITDFIQGVLTVVLSFLILPFALNHVGGLVGLRETIPNPETVFSIVAPGEITLLYIIVIAANGLIGWVTAPYEMAVCGAGKTEQDARVGLVCGMFLKRICTIAWFFNDTATTEIYTQGSVNPDEVWGLMAGEFLPQIAPGLVGLFVASMLAAVMSSCDCFMVSSAALFTENIYRPLIRPGQQEKHYVFVGRMASILVVVCGISVAFAVSGVVEGLEVFWKVHAMMGIAIWASFFWRRATAAATWASTLSGFAAWAFTSKIAFLNWDFNARFARHLPDFTLYEGQLSLPWQMIFYLTVGLVVMIVVSLITKPPSKEKLDRVYECLRTPVMEGEPEVEPLTLPEGVKPAPRSVLIDHPDFELMKPTATSVFGFLACCAGVGLLIGAFVWIIS
jgi:Na+/proline symporter